MWSGIRNDKLCGKAELEWVEQTYSGTNKPQSKW